MRNLSPIGYHVYDIYAYLRDSKPYTLRVEDKIEIETWFNKKNESLSDNRYKGMLKGKNLIFIGVESLEEFIINREVQSQGNAVKGIELADKILQSNYFK